MKKKRDDQKGSKETRNYKADNEEKVISSPYNTKVANPRTIENHLNDQRPTTEEDWACVLRRKGNFDTASPSGRAFRGKKEGVGGSFPRVKIEASETTAYF